MVHQRTMTEGQCVEATKREALRTGLGFRGRPLNNRRWVSCGSILHCVAIVAIGSSGRQAVSRDSDFHISQDDHHAHGRHLLSLSTSLRIRNAIFHTRTLSGDFFIFHAKYEKQVRLKKNKQNIISNVTGRTGGEAL